MKQTGWFPKYFRAFPPELEQEYFRHQFLMIRTAALQLMTFGPVLVLLFTLRDLLNDAATTWPALRIRLLGAAALVALRLYASRIYLPHRFCQMGVLYLWLTHISFALVAADLEAGLLHDQTALMLIPLAAAPLWLRLWDLLLANLGICGILLALLLRERPERVIWADYASYFLVIAFLSLVLYGVADRIRRENFLMQRDLTHAANVDPLTGLCNRRHFFERARCEFARAAQGGETVAMLFADLDHFKQINDCYGHEQGDRALRQAAGDFHYTLRAHREAIAGRIGGEEFACLLPGIDLSAALDLAERIRHGIYRHLGETQRLSVSIGVAEREEGESLDQLLARADMALLQAKRDGRNRVVAAAGALVRRDSLAASDARRAG